MPRPQFTLRALLVAMLVVAAFFGGMAVQSQIDEWNYEGYEQYVESLRVKDKDADGAMPLP